MKQEKQKELLRVVKDNYDNIAEEYSQTRKKKLWPELVKFLKEVENGESVLDVGCGSGKILAELSEKKIEYLGIDQSSELLYEAKADYPDYKFLEGDVLDLGKVSKTNFDHVFCIAVLHHLPGEELRVRALRQLKNKIRGDGRIVISVWDLWSSRKYKKLIWKFYLLKFFKKHGMDFGDILFDWIGPDNKASKRYYHAFTKRELRRISKKAGLKIEKLYKDRYNYYLVLK